MGVNNLKNVRRVTLYLATSHLNFLDEVINTLSSDTGGLPSRSDVLRTILNTYTGLEHWKDEAILSAIQDARKKGACNAKS